MREEPVLYGAHRVDSEAKQVYSMNPLNLYVLRGVADLNRGTEDQDKGS